MIAKSIRVWNYETKEARFVEVKGPGDSLSETQKVGQEGKLHSVKW